MSSISNSPRTSRSFVSPPGEANATPANLSSRSLTSRSSATPSLGGASPQASRPASASSQATVPTGRTPAVPRLHLERAYPMSRTARRNLTATFDAIAAQGGAAWDPSSPRSRTAGSEAPMSQRSVSSQQSRDSVASAILQIVGDQHDEAMARMEQQYPDVVQAMAAVIGDIEARTETPTPGGSGYNTPLWRDKVETLDANFVERLLPLTVARALLNQDDYEDGVFRIFDSLEDSREQMAVGFLLVAAVEQAKVVLASASAPGAGQAIAHGIETRRWAADTAPDNLEFKAMKDLGTAAMHLATRLPAITRNALVRAACAAAGG